MRYSVAFRQMPVLNRFSKLAALAFTLNIITAMMFNMTAFAPSASAQTASTAPKRLLGYYPEWGKTQTPPYTAAQIPYSQLTHINHAFVLIAPGADVVVPTRRHALPSQRQVESTAPAGVGGPEQQPTAVSAPVAGSDHIGL